MESRIQQMQHIMAKEGIAACLLKQPENLVLFTGYWSRNGFSYLFIPAKGEAVILAPKGDMLDSDSGFYTNVIKFGFIHREQGDAMVNLTNILLDLKVQNHMADGCIIGADFGGDVYALPLCSGEVRPWSATDEALLSNVFHPEAITSVYTHIAKLRRCKNPLEVSKIRIACQLAKRACDFFESFLQQQEDLTEIAIAAEIEKYIAIHGQGIDGSVYARGWAQVTSGPRTAAEGWYAGVVSSSRKVSQGEFVMLELGLVVDGYWADLTRTSVAGSASSEQTKLLQMVKDAQLAALKRIKPGVCAGDVDEGARQHLVDKGYGDYFIHGTGHGVGFVYHEGEPFIVPHNNFVLEEGMVHSCEPGIYMEDHGQLGHIGIRNEVNVLVTKDGYDILG